MNRMFRTMLAFAGLASFAPAHASEEALPAALWQALPTATEAERALDTDPGVLRAAAERDAAAARAEGRRASPHEWIATGQWLEREVDGEGRYGEWEFGLSRALRLPGKAAADRRIAGEEERVAANAYADARHVAAIALLDRWFDWRAALESERLAAASAATAAEDLARVEKRHAHGDAAAADLDAMRAAAAQEAMAARLATLAREEADNTLRSQYPGLRLDATDALPAPQLPPEAVAAWRERVVRRSHEIELAQAQADLATARAERARLDRRADPSIGLRTLNERGGVETGLGLVFSVPIGGSARRAVANEQLALAAAHAADAEAVRRRIEGDASAFALRSEAAHAAWMLAQQAAEAARSQRDRLRRGHELGGVGIEDLLAARRRALEATQQETQARVAAHRAISRLLLDAHAFWIAGDHGDLHETE